MKNKRENELRDNLKTAEVFGPACLLRVHGRYPLDIKRRKEKGSVFSAITFIPNSQLKM